MALTRSKKLIPPMDLVSQSESVVIVSSKRPVCIYFERVQEILTERLFSMSPGSSFQLKLTGAGGAISRCEQLSRYTMQSLKSKFQHIVKNTSKTSELGETSTTDLNIPTDEKGELDLLSMTPVKRPVRTLTITIHIQVV
jgi:hypothetical protein